MTYSGDIKTFQRLKEKLGALEDNEVIKMWEHIRAQNFHPDTEFRKFRLEGKITDDEFVDALMEEVDERNRRLVMTPATA